jgi:hypothetical protein
MRCTIVLDDLSEKMGERVRALTLSPKSLPSVCLFSCPNAMTATIRGRGDVDT